jgi:hypothetical protein
VARASGGAAGGGAPGPHHRGRPARAPRPPTRAPCRIQIPPERAESRRSGGRGATEVGGEGEGAGDDGGESERDGGGGELEREQKRWRGGKESDGLGFGAAGGFLCKSACGGIFVKTTILLIFFFFVLN